jgi:hypothetical protein
MEDGIARVPSLHDDGYSFNNDRACGNAGIDFIGASSIPAVDANHQAWQVTAADASSRWFGRILPRDILKLHLRMQSQPTWPLEDRPTRSFNWSRSLGARESTRSEKV